MAQPTVTPPSSAKTRPNTPGDITALSREAIEALPAAVYMTDAEGRLTFYNEAAVALWGCRPRLGESKFCGSWKLYWPDGTPLPHHECPMAMALHQQQPIRGMEAVAERPDGTRVPFIPYPTPLFDASGALTGAVNMLVDTSERKESEERLRKRDQEARELLGALPAAIYVTDAEGHLTYCNQSAVDLWGTKPTLGKDKWSSLTRFYHSDGSPMALTDCPTELALKLGQSVRGREAIMERNDGTRIPIIPYPTALRDETGAIVGVVNMTVDITEHKKAELALAERDALIGLAEKVARVGNFTVDLNTGRVQLSAGCAAIHGFPEGTVEARHDDWRAGVHPDDLARLDRLFSQAFTERWPEYKADYRINRSGGEVRWIVSRTVISYDRNGRPERFVGVNIDVTERKMAEDALRRREAELAEAQRLAHIGNWSWDAATNTLAGSDELFRIFGWDPTQPIPNIREQLGRNFSREDWERLRAVMRDTMQTGVGYVLDLVAFRNGTPILVTTRGEAIRNDRGQIVGLRGTVEDITERKMAEQALAERNLQLALAGKAGRVGSFAYDIDTEIMQISAGYAAIHGFPDGTTEIARSEWQLGVHPEDRVRWEALRSRAYRERWDEYSGEYRTVRSGSEYRWIEARVFVSYDGDGRPRRAVGVDIDITARKRAEEQQGTLIAELDHRVKNVLATVSAIAAHTRDASTSMDHFVAALDGRIRSMATTHELLSARRWHGVSLIELARGELAPYATRNNTEIGGPEVTLSAEAGQVVSMALHELTTNAAKHGALSVHDGRVSVHWHHASSGNVDARIAIEWQETGGPAVQAPDTCGYGMEVIRDLIPYELGGTVDLAFAPDGLRCRLEVPASWLHGGALHGTLSAAGQPLHAVP